MATSHHSKDDLFMKFPSGFRGVFVAPWLFMLGACQSAPVADQTLPKGPAPTACGTSFVRTAGILTLPPAESAPAQADKGTPMKFASEFPVGGGARDIGRWHQTLPGWESWRLRLVSEGASSLSLHFRPFVLPEGGALWICAPGGQRQGPYTLRGPNGRGGLWTPQVKGSEIWVDLILPEGSRNTVQAKIAEAFAGYRK